MYLRTTVVVLSCSLAISLGGLAHAQGDRDTRGDDAEARRLFERGRTAYEREFYTEAEDAFVAAYEAMPEEDTRRALILANVAQAIERQGGRDEDALAMWRDFEREARFVASDAALLKASQRIRELEERLARRREGDEEGGDAETGDGERRDDARRRPHPAGVALTAAGGALVVVGAVTGIVALEKRRSTLARCDGTLCPEEARAEARRIDRLALSSDLFVWPGLALAAAGAVMMIKLDAGKDRRVTASCGVTGCTIEGRF